MDYFRIFPIIVLVFRPYIIVVDGRLEGSGNEGEKVAKVGLAQGKLVEGGLKSEHACELVPALFTLRQLACLQDDGCGPG